MYGSLFCRLYNEFGWNEYPRVFGEQLLVWLERHSVRVRTALDLGCGTGVLCETLNAHGIETMGVDFSETIREKVHDVEDVCGLLRETGFALVQCADRLLTEGSIHGTTWFIVARRDQSSTVP